ncbi:SusC/RagA family TonB-linked outer membrane protein [Flavitalea flava]
MRLTFLVVLGAAMHVSASGIAQKITLHERNASLRNVLTELQRQSHYDFIYTNEQLALSKAVNLNVQSADLQDVLNQLFSDQPLTYMIDDNSIIIRDKPVGKAPPINAKPPEGPPGSKVIGIVLDEKGNPIAGASVQAKHSNAGSSTDKNGYFMLKEVSEKDTLIVSFIGYRTRSVPVSNNIMLTIKMEEATDALDEVIIQGYGHTTQRLTTANIGRVTSSEIGKQPVTDPLLAIEGRIAGVVVTPQSGYEAGPVKVEIRGRNSLNSSFTSDPLYVIDGVPLTILDVAGTVRNDLSTSNISRGLDQTGLSISLGQSPMYNINPADIESIDVLKDADATAIYGSRGANGVILITTKKGKPGTNVFDLQVAEGISFNTRAWPLLKTPQYLEMRRQAFRNDGVVPTVLNAPDLFLWDTTRYVDWQKAAYGGVGQNLHLTSSVSGGTAQTTFRVGAGYDRVTDITRVAGANQRATVSININNTSSNKRFQTAISANYAYSILNQVRMDGQASLPPNAPPPYDSSGKLNFREWDQAGVQLPFTALLQPYNSRTNAISTNLSLSYLILKNLKAAVSFGYNNNQAYQSRLTPIASQDPYSLIKPTGINNYGNSRSNNWIIEPQLTYSTFSGRHKFDFLAGATAQSNVTDGLLVTGSGYTSV